MANLLGVAGLEAVEVITLGLGALQVIPTVAQGNGGLRYTPVKVERRMAREPSRAFSRRHVFPIFGASSQGGFGNDFAQVKFLVEVDSNDCGELVGLVRHSLDGSTDFSRSSLAVVFTSLGLFPRSEADDPRTHPVRVAYQGSYDKVGNGHWDFRGQFEFNAFGYFRVLRHKVVSRSFADWAISGKPADFVYAFPNRLAWKTPPLPAKQRELLQRELEKKEKKRR